ncbi:MAG: TonB-dependent receptor [Nannocystaceae bacterium]|nr:TonB-dependent receptor [Nannocystaceae bacterium]
MLAATLLVHALALAGVASPSPHDTGADSRSQASFRGIVTEGGNGRAIAGAHLLLIVEPTTGRAGRLRRHQHLDASADPTAAVQTESDDEGGFEFEAPPSRRLRLIVLAPGYERLEQIVELPLRNNKRLSVYLTPATHTVYRTVVKAPRPPEPGRVTTRELSAEEIRTLPGTQGDPLRALQNFPGVARTPGGLGVLVLRGAAPNQSRVFFGEHALPRAFHVTGLSSVVPADAIDRIEFLPSNAPARYGSTTGGVVAIVPRQLSRDKLHGYADIDLAGGAALVRGPIGKGAFLIGAQRSWIDAPLRVAGKIAEIGFTLPQYSDYQALFELPGRRVQIRMLGGIDRIDIQREGMEEVRPFRFGAQFHRVDLVFKRRHGPWRLLFSPSLRYEHNVIEVQEQTHAQRDDLFVSWRAEAERKLSPRASLMVGVDGEIDPYRAQQAEPVLSADPGSFETQTRYTSGVQSTLGVYSTADIRFGRVTLWPGIRVSTFTAGPQAKVAADPRLAGRWSIGDRVALSFGAGLYSQPDIPQRGNRLELVSSLVNRVVLPAAFAQLEPTAGFAPEQSVRVARAAQTSAALSVTPSPLWLLELGAYGRLRDNNTFDKHVELIGGLGTDVVTHPDAVSVDYGLEAIIRRQPRRALYGWLSYTLSRSELRVPDDVPDVPPRFPGAFDQRHIFALVASYRLPRRFRLGGRFRLVSGSPYTDIVGVIDGPGDLQQPLLGRPNEARFPTFHQLDIRVDKVWYRQRASMTLYLDIQNVYNRQNVEAYSYGFRGYRNKTASIGLPIFPSLGFRVDW